MNTHDTETQETPREAMELFDQELKRLERANPEGVTARQLTRLADKVTKKYYEFIQRCYSATSSH